MLSINGWKSVSRHSDTHVADKKIYTLPLSSFKQKIKIRLENYCIYARDTNIYHINVDSKTFQNMRVFIFPYVFSKLTAMTHQFIPT